jgi:hypothetical protein
MEKTVAIFEEEVVKVFKPQTVDIQALADSCKGLKINGIEDEAGYELVFDALQKIKKARTDLTKFAKSLRDEYTAKNRKIKEIENDYLKIITPIEDDLKVQREEVDQAKKRKEREILLPERQKMLREIGNEIDDDFVLDMDANQFQEFFNQRKLEFLEMKERQLNEEKERLEKEKREAEEAKIREAELEKARTEAAEKARIEAEQKAEREKQEAIEKIKREQEEKDAKIRAENFRIAQEAVEKEKAEKAEQEKTEKNRKYKAWLKEHGFTEELRQAGEMHVMRDGNTFTLYKKVDKITI